MDGGINKSLEMEPFTSTAWAVIPDLPVGRKQKKGEK